MYNRKSLKFVFITTILIICFCSCASVQEKSQKNPAQLLESAKTAYNEGNIDESINLLKQVSSKDETAYSEANILLGKLYLKLTDYKKSLGSFKKAVTTDPNNAFAIYYIGYLNQKINKFHTAYNYYKKAIFIDRNLLNARYNPLVVKNMFFRKLYIYIYTIEEDHLFSPITDSYSFYDENVIANLPHEILLH